MYWSSLGLATCLAATGTWAGLAQLVAEGMRQGNSAALENRLQELAKAQIAARGGIESVLPRQATAMNRPTNGSASAPVVVNPDGSVDMRIWDVDVKTSCTQAIGMLPQSSNPTGTCVCYNLPVLNNATGQFEADLRLFHLNAPTGQFAGIPPEKVMVSLTFHGASVSAVHNMTGANNGKPQKRQLSSNALAPVPVAGGRDLRQLQQYLFVGQIDMSKVTHPMAAAQLEALVTPTVTLSAVSPTNQIVQTNVSTNEASFLVGVFSDVAVFNSETLAIMAINKVMADLRSDNGNTAFVLPGVNILIAPIGLIITSAWLVIGLLFIGFGTVERINYAESYKRRMQRANKGQLTRI